MKMFIYTIKDNHIGVYSRPIFSQYDIKTMIELNERAIKNNIFDKELENKELYYLGEYLDNTANFNISEKEYLLTFPELKKDKKNENKK